MRSDQTELRAGPDSSFVGRSLPAVPYRVGREKIREFALAIGEGNPVCRDVDAARAAGHPDVVAPPTFTVSFTLPLITEFLHDPTLRWDYSRMVHADQSITLHRPIHGGDDLVTVLHVDSLTSRAGSHLLTLRCEVADAGGAPVATTRALLVTQGSV